MKLKIAWIGKTKDPAIQSLTAEYLKRISRYTEVDGLTVPDESALLKLREKTGSRPAHTLVLLDSRGKQLSSEEFAQFLQNHQDRNPQPLVFAIGPADGFTDEARKAASARLRLVMSRSITNDKGGLSTRMTESTSAGKRWVRL